MGGPPAMAPPPLRAGESPLHRAAYKGHTATAEALLAGGKSKNGRGADVVIRDMEDLPSVVNTFLDMRMDDPTTCDRDHFDFEKIRPALRDRCWTTAGKTGVVEVEDPNPR